MGKVVPPLQFPHWISIGVNGLPPGWPGAVPEGCGAATCAGAVPEGCGAATCAGAVPEGCDAATSAAVIVSALLPAVAASDLLELELPVPCCLALMKAFMLVCFCSLGSKSGTVSIPKSFVHHSAFSACCCCNLVSVQSGRVSVLYHSHIKQMYSIV